VVIEFAAKVKKNQFAPNVLMDDALQGIW